MHGVSCLITEYSCEYGSAKFYALCGFGGVLSCGLTHTAVVPLDLVKCSVYLSIPINVYWIKERMRSKLPSPVKGYSRLLFKLIYL